MTQRERLTDIINKSRFFSTTEEIVDYLIDNGVSISRTCVDTSFGEIIAERNCDMNYPEIYVGIEKNGEWIQDLVCVRERYHYDDKSEKVNDGDVEVYLFRDCDTDDYTDRIIVKVYEHSET